jgi:uncharacterized Tic20 family protein
MVKTRERLLAALSHAGAFMPGMGIVIQALVWSLQRKKSKYVSGQSAQAIAYHIGFVAIYTLAVLILSIVTFLVVLLQINQLKNSSHVERLLAVPGGLFVGSIILLSALFGLFALVGVITCLLGKEFQYPFLGKWMQNYLAQKISDPEKDPSQPVSQMERWVAACSHLSIFITPWGIALPFILWLTAEKSELEFRNETRQASILQCIQAVFFGILFVLPFLLFLVIHLLYPSLLQYNPSDSGSMIFQMGLSLVMLLILLVAMLVLALFQTFGIVAAVQILRGSPYDYPIIGRWLGNRANPKIVPVTPG